MLDASYYPSDLRIPGIEDSDKAYDALNSALAVNFNTIYAVRNGNKVALRREADADHSACDQPVPGAGARTDAAASAWARTLRWACNTPAS